MKRTSGTLPSFLAALLVIAGCVPSEYIADYGLHPAGPATLDGDAAPGTLHSFVFDRLKGVRSVRYEDERLAVDWTVYSTRPRLEVENRTAAPLRVIWSETRIEGDFEAPLVLASPGPRDQRDLPQQPTVVEPGTREKYHTVPGPPGRWQPFTRDESRGFWQGARPMFDLDVNGAPGKRERNALAERALGSELRLVLVLEIDGRRHALRLPARVAEVSTRASYY
jgi:hypothetical protein